MDTDRPYWDMENEPLFNTPDMDKIQLEKLHDVVTLSWFTLTES